MKARVVAGVEHRAAADAIEIGDLDGRISVIDRIVRSQPAPVRADREILGEPGFPVPTRTRESGALLPVALLQTKNTHLRLGKAPGNRRAGSTRSDNKNVYSFVHGQSIRLHAALRHYTSK